ncbi:FkbM family methyltransferase [Rhodothermus profundi]|uniref:Methyltransferase, FkbM family n=1 Tax=Rhodothermus profundi TaxID=633813 RepID=A0A1M6XK58_9BACT|nr:FkbM family methyltransferase [Rhodothermus profundi]SHL06286.1 methyltransferase, FkbM family [Rhodothermus profundi]
MFWHLLPPSWIRWMGRLPFKLSVFRPFIDMIARFLRQGEHVMAHGIGKGLRFDPAGLRAGYALGTADLEEQKVLAAWLRCGQVFYDIGANVGFFSVLAAKLVGPTGKVYAFEPFLQNIEAIRKNAALNSFEEIIEIWHGAVSNRSGSGKLVLCESSDRFRLEDTAVNAPSITVPLYTIDELVLKGRLRPPDLVKIDVEGHELQVLQGMEETIRRYRPVILCEVHWWVGENEALLKELVLPLGYRIAQIDDKTMLGHLKNYHLLMIPGSVSGSRQKRM